MTEEKIALYVSGCSSVSKNDRGRSQLELLVYLVK